MGKIEQNSKERRKKLSIRNALLLGLAGGATVLASTILGPTAFVGFVALGTPQGKRLPEPRLKRSLHALVNSGYVEWKTNGDRKYLEITNKGQSHLRKRRIGNYEVPKSKRWDGKWRIVMFDIKETRRVDRDLLRDELEAIGFYRFQNSVWVYPYDCEDLITLIKSDYRLGMSVVYIIAEEVENDASLRKHFNLF